MEKILLSFANAKPTYIDVYVAILRWLIPILVCLLIFRCAKSLLMFRREPEIWAWLTMADGKKKALTHWENVIGRHKNSDIQIDFPTISRVHAVLTRYDDGSWTITDADSKAGTFVNGERISIQALEPGDIITLGGVEMMLLPITKRQERRQAELRTRPATVWGGMGNLLLLTAVQCFICFAFLLGGDLETMPGIFAGFAGIVCCQWLLFIFYTVIRRTSFEMETLAFFLCALGMAAIATDRPDEALKQLCAMLLGVGCFLGVGWSLRDLERAKICRYVAAIAGFSFLVITLLFGEEYHGAKNWLNIAGVSLQPSELSKVCFVYAGASAMDRIMTKRNILLFIVYSVAICGCLAVMNDFGTAFVFFCAFLVIAYLRSGSVGTIAMACTSLGFAGVVALKIAPHAAERFKVWRHIWEDPLDQGFQQTRALMSIASGGLLGLGAGNGKLKNVFAADSDIVFATISEEWGLIIAVLTVVCIVILALFSLRTVSVSRSSFYTIGAVTAASILLVQTMLNCLGTVDVLPFTGVTFPFLSNGGTSMIAAWGLLGFIKAADTRQNASFAVKLTRLGRDVDE